MDSPKAMHRKRISIDMSMGRAVKDSAPAPWPSWNIHTSTPAVADSVSALNSRARTGWSRLPVKANSSSRVEAMMIRAA